MIRTLSSGPYSPISPSQRAGGGAGLGDCAKTAARGVAAATIRAHESASFRRCFCISPDYADYPPTLKLSFDLTPSVDPDVPVLAWPLRCAANLGLVPFSKKIRSMTVRVGDPLKKRSAGRQVIDLPRIRVAEPSHREPSVSLITMTKGRRLAAHRSGRAISQVASCVPDNHDQGPGDLPRIGVAEPSHS